MLQHFFHGNLSIAIRSLFVLIYILLPHDAKVILLAEESSARRFIFHPSYKLLGMLLECVAERKQGAFIIAIVPVCATSTCSLKEIRNG